MTVAVVFDMDGVIVDNGKYHLLAFKELSRRHAVDFSAETFKKRFFGRVNEEILPELFGRSLSASEISKLADEKEALYREIFQPHLKPLPGFDEFFKELKSKKVPVGLATSAPGENVEFVLQGLNIQNDFDAVVDDSMVSKGKPNPEIYLKAASLLHCRPEQCVVFEDSLSGTQAAWDAGSKVIALTTTLTEREHKFAHHIVKDFSAITLDFILTLFD